MYTNYFGFKKNPFSISPDPSYLYMSELHREALAHLLYGISSDGCFILLTGDVGTGKTTVCRCLLAQLPDSTDVALIVNPRLTVLELLQTICDELRIPREAGQSSVKSHIDRLNSYLLEAHGSGRNVALLIDEAQNLSLDLLEQLRLLTNLETDQKKLLKIVLLGQSELIPLLEQPAAAQINQRITSRFHLLPLGREDCSSYIHHRLAVSGERRQVFSQKALARIFELSRGIPRLVNVICDRSLLGAYVEEKRQVNVKIVEKAAGEVLGRETKGQGGARWQKIWPRLLPVALLLVAGALGVSYYFRAQLPDWDMGAPFAAAPPVIEKTVNPPSKTVPEEVPPPMTEPEEEKRESGNIRMLPLKLSD